VLQALGGPVILLFWLYVMANVIVFGAEVNWWVAQRRAMGVITPPRPRPPGDDAVTIVPPDTIPEPGPADSAPSPSEQR
jgi:uncharacterized BrkB/YihY/UPF0761 family membrane protein